MKRKHANWYHSRIHSVLLKIPKLLFLVLTAIAVNMHQQVQAQSPGNITVTGKVTSDSNEPLKGASVSEQGTKNAVIAGENGSFKIVVSGSKSVLVVSFVGYNTASVILGAKHTDISVQLTSNVQTMDNVVVVGYGRQKKESVVAAITQTTGKVLERAGGVSSVGAALTGNLPGVITSASTGLPGGEDPQILIRGRSTWNSTDPLVLVDGVERSIASVDISSVETISILKDASATAVFGVRGANGVIIITTKRGRLGKPSIRATVNTTMKVPSKLPNKYDSYDALSIRNKTIEYELALKPDSWNDYLPEAILQKYRNPANLAEAERYPNVDWAKTLFKDYTVSHNASINIAGGTKFVKYFSSADFLNEGDLFKIYENKRGYNPGFGYNRLNVRNNLDFQLTPSTLFKVNLAGSYAVKKSPWGFTGSEYGAWIDAYTTAPDVFKPVYADGSWGFYQPNEGRAENSARNLATSGIQNITTAGITTDFSLEQSLDKLVKGLKFNGNISLDNTFTESNRGVNDLFHDVQRKWIDPATGNVFYKQAYDGLTGFDFQEGINWTSSAGNITSNYRRLFYQLQLNYATTIARKHYVTAMGLVNRNQYATGSEVPHFREDWVFRGTYTYANKYTIEYNGSYNGSEQFSAKNRFGFFQSGGVNWVVTKEKFMENVKFLNLLKIRASYGQIGSDNVGAARWLYMSQWGYGGQSRLGVTNEAAEQSPYVWYRELSVGNPDVRWEKSEKKNIGFDADLFHGILSLKGDLFQDYRTGILIAGGSRSIPSYYGATAPVANLGKTKTTGYEFEVHVKYPFANRLRLWADLNMTHTKNVVIDRDDPELAPLYQKAAGKEIGQAYSYISAGYYNNWDELYASTMWDVNDGANGQKLPGNFYLVDYNGDGVIDAKDNIPYGYSSAPQNTYNATIGADWKGFSMFLQFYAANNVTRQVVFNSLGSQSHTVYNEGSYWSKNNTSPDVPMPRWLSTPAGYYRANQYMYDGSYVRLKNAEVSYTFDKNSSMFIKRMGVDNLRVYLNGNNLFVWSKMPDDRESNFAGTGWASQGAYPTVKRYNLGLNLTF